MLRTRVLVVALLAACGGGSSSPPAKEPTSTVPENTPPEEEIVENAAPEEEPETDPEREEGSRDFTFQATGAAECDALVINTMCMYDNVGSSIPAEAWKAFGDGVRTWSDALKNDATRQATIDACKMSLDAGMEGFKSVGCW